MDIVTELKKRRSQILAQISQVAHDDDCEAIFAAAEDLKKVEVLIRRYDQLDREGKKLIAKSVNTEPSEANSDGPAVHTDSITTSPHGKSARAHGKEIREAFLAELAQEGIHLQRCKGTIYKTTSGERVGIAVATERQPDHWFLGLTAGSFDHVVLLCQRDNGEVVEICLPRKFFEQYGNAMSQSKGQVKFNITYRGNQYFVQVPGTSGVSASEFSRGHSFLH